MKLVANDAIRAYNRQLLRALLREASYLPDAISRDYIHDHVVHRFRSYNPRIAATQRHQGQNERPLIAADRQPKLQRSARKALHKLNRANNAYQSDLLKVFHYAYGRVGKKCWQLLDPLTRPDRNLDNPALKLKNRNNIPPGIVEQLPGPSLKLQALLTSQIAHSPSQSVKRKLKRLDPEIPERNAWLRPMPAKRIVNAVKDWYGGLRRKALPPPPELEWQHLKKLATGEQKWEGPIERRSYCGTDQEAFNYRQCLGIIMAEDSEADTLGVPTGAGVERRHHLDQRFMKRMYQAVFKECSNMEWNTSKQKWTVTWGSKFLAKSVRNANANHDLVGALLVEETLGSNTT